MRINTFISSMAILMLVAGCDQPPPPDSLPPVTPVSADVVTDQGRGTYDWRVTPRGYVLRPEEPDEDR